MKLKTSAMFISHNFRLSIFPIVTKLDMTLDWNDKINHYL